MQQGSAVFLDRLAGQRRVLRRLYVMQLVLIGQILTVGWVEQAPLDVTAEIQRAGWCGVLIVTIPRHHHRAPELVFVKICFANPELSIRRPNDLRERPRLLVVTSAFKVVVTHCRIP